jgi:hypothetical protein
MRAFIILVLSVLVGCSTPTHPLVFNIRSADVVTASAAPLDTSQESADFKAQIHIVFQAEAARRFRNFTETHTGQLFELQVNGEVLLPAVSARPAGGRESSWFTSSIKEAQRFAESLNRK